jgi:hypothetical protein
MSDFAQEAGSGFGGYFTRTFSIFTLGFGIWLFIDPSALGTSGEIPVDILMPALLILGSHGVVTKYSDVGIFRKFLCYMSGVPGAVYAFKVIGQIFGNY